MLEIKGVSFNVSIERKRIRNIYIRVDETNVYVTAPFYVAEYKVYQFIESKRDWIYKAYLHSSYKKLTTHKYHGGDKFYIFGIEYNLIRTIGKKDVKIVGNDIYLSYKDDSDNAISYLYKYLDNRLLIKAQEYLEKYQYILDDYGYNLKPELNAKIMSSKWGVCYTRKNKINISSYLIHYDLDCLEYIVIHELAHFIVPNHSKRFYELINANMPLYKIANEKLKK